MFYFEEIISVYWVIGNRINKSHFKSQLCLIFNHGTDFKTSVVWSTKSVTKSDYEQRKLKTSIALTELKAYSAVYFF